MQERSLSNQSETWRGPEKRRSPRTQTDSPARLKVINSSTSSARSISARVRSASLHGLQLQIGFILPKTPVQIHVFNRLVSGEVQYCVFAGQDIRVSVFLNEGL
jgi:hypothetical protein